jgi:hypothetical protein
MLATTGSTGRLAAGGLRVAETERTRDHEVQAQHAQERAFAHAVLPRQEGALAVQRDGQSARFVQQRMHAAVDRQRAVVVTHVGGREPVRVVAHAGHGCGVQRAVQPARLRAPPRERRRQRDAAAVQQRTRAQQHLQRAQGAPPQDDAILIAHVHHHEVVHGDADPAPAPRRDEQRGRDRRYQQHGGARAASRPSRGAAAAYPRQQRGHVDVRFAQAGQLAIEGLQLRGIVQQRLHADAPRCHGRIIEAAAQVALQHLAPEDARAGCKRVRVTGQQQVAPGSVVEQVVRLRLGCE